MLATLVAQASLQTALLPDGARTALPLRLAAPSRKPPAASFSGFGRPEIQSVPGQRNDGWETGGRRVGEDTVIHLACQPQEDRTFEIDTWRKSATKRLTERRGHWRRCRRKRQTRMCEDAV